MNAITTKRLDCGMPLIVESIPGVKSAGFSWLLPAGTATEPENRQGLCAMWTELLLRGAGDLDSRAHADALDRLGAGRSTDAGGYHLRISGTMLGSRMVEALPLVVDMVRRPKFDPDSIEPVRDLALQALDSLKDEPQERASLAARQRHYPVPLNRSSLGTREGLTAITRDELATHWKARAVPGGSILAIAGAVDADALTTELNRLLRGWTGQSPDVTGGPTPPRGYAHETDQTNQVQILIMHDAPPESDPSSLLEKIVVSVLSGGMSGRLFSEVREKRGLCYAVSASYAAGKDFGAVAGYVGTTPERAQESLTVMLAELARINTPEGKVERDEFDRAVIGMKSRLVFSGESTSGRAASLAYDQHRLGRPRSLDEISRQIDSVTLDAVNAYLSRRKPGSTTIQTLGPAALTPP
ncbi:MAG TPA: pitrilysin family protein [Micromonosporaceae bacterium]